MERLGVRDYDRRHSIVTKSVSTWPRLSRPSSTAAFPAEPAGTVDVSVDGEWSFAQTLRHLVLATDMWLGRAVLQIEKSFHPSV